MNRIQVARLTLAAAILILPSQVKAQVSQLIEASSDRFFDECASAINDPQGYLANAHAAQQDDQIELITNDDGGLYYVHHTAPPGELAVQFGQAAPDRLRLLCRVAVFNDLQLMNAEATRQAFEDVLESNPELRSVGGKLDLQNPVAGASSQTGMMMRHVADIYHYHITGLSGADHIAQAAIQANMYEIWIDTLLTESVAIGD